MLSGVVMMSRFNVQSSPSVSTNCLHTSCLLPFFAYLSFQIAFRSIQSSSPIIVLGVLSSGGLHMQVYLVVVLHAPEACLYFMYSHKGLHMPKTCKGANLNKVCLSYALHGIHTWSSRSYPSFCHLVICFVSILL